MTVECVVAEMLLLWLSLVPLLCQASIIRTGQCAKFVRGEASQPTGTEYVNLTIGATVPSEARTGWN